MNDHPPDLEAIIDLTTGDLPPEEAERLERSLDSQARAELATQRAARKALESLPSPDHLSDTERRRLRTVVEQRLRLDGPAHRGRVRRRRSRLSARAFPAMAAFAALVLVVAVALRSGNRFGGDEEAFESPATFAVQTTRLADATTMAAMAADAAAADATDDAPGTVVETEPVTERADDAVTSTTVAATRIVTEADLAAAQQEEAATVEESAETTDTTAVEVSILPYTPPTLFDISSADQLEALGRILQAVSEGETNPAPLHELMERSPPPELICRDSAASTAGPDVVVYFLARGVLGGAETEAYLLVEDTIAAEDIDILEGINLYGILLFSAPDCELIRLPGSDPG